jgi:hypothetical protein
MVHDMALIEQRHHESLAGKDFVWVSLGTGIITLGMHVMHMN